MAENHYPNLEPDACAIYRNLVYHRYRSISLYSLGSIQSIHPPPPTPQVRSRVKPVISQLLSRSEQKRKRHRAQNFTPILINLKSSTFR